MKSAVVILTLLGCDCDGVACEYIRTVSSDWTTVENCEASSDFRKMTAVSVSYPLVIARCSIGGGGPASREVAGHGDTSAGSDGQAAGSDAEPGETGRIEAGNSLKGRIGGGAAHSIRAVGSSLKTYVGEPVRAFAGRVLAGLRD